MQCAFEPKCIWEVVDEIRCNAYGHVGLNDKSCTKKESDVCEHILSQWKGMRLWDSNHGMTQRMGCVDKRVKPMDIVGDGWISKNIS